MTRTTTNRQIVALGETLKHESGHCFYIVFNQGTFPEIRKANPDKVHSHKKINTKLGYCAILHDELILPMNFELPSDGYESYART